VFTIRWEKQKFVSIDTYHKIQERQQRTINISSLFLFHPWLFAEKNQELEFVRRAREIITRLLLDD
jgi:hypothetical protein